MLVSATIQDVADKSLPPDLLALIDARGLRGRTCLIGVDGLGAAGKTTFADRLAAEIDGVVVHTDELSAPGSDPWEIDRFVDQIWTPLSQGEPARYQVHHWTKAQAGEWIELPTGVPIVLEGVRSTARANPAAFDLRIWVESDRATRVQRAAARDPARFSCWTNNWMPIEDAWLATERPDLAADFIVHG